MMLGGGLFMGFGILIMLASRAAARPAGGGPGGRTREQEVAQRVSVNAASCVEAAFCVIAQKSPASAFGVARTDPVEGEHVGAIVPAGDKHHRDRIQRGARLEQAFHGAYGA